MDTSVAATEAADRFIDRQRVRVTPDGRVTRREAARYIGHSEKTLANWALEGKGPRSFKVSGKRFYWLADLDAFIRGGEHAA